MKKFFMAAVALLMCGSAMALENEPAPGFTNEVHFGMALARLRGDYSGFKVKPGFTLGYKGEYTLPGAHGTFINAGLDLTQKGSKVSGEKLNAYYLSLPIHVGYRYNINSHIGTFADFGPYFAMGLGGKFKDNDYKYFNKDEGNHKRFDCGLGFRVGAEYDKHLNLTLGFDWGLTDEIKHNPSGADALQNFCTTITVGYRF